MNNHDLFATPADTDADALARLHQTLERAAEEEGLLDVAYRTVDSPVGTLLLAATPRGLVRVAAVHSEQLDACIFVGPAETSPQWDVVRSLFEAGVVAERDRRILLSGRSGDGLAETGPMICACYSVGLAAIRKAIATGEAASVADIGRTLRAGTNCGSCVAELRAIIEEMAKTGQTRTGAKPTAVPASA